ncbi:alcohol dehydrogenase, partial [Streptomyces rubellomurinus subsp. indigoferus]
VLRSTGRPNLPFARLKVCPSPPLLWFPQASRAPAPLDFFDLLNGPEHVTIQHFRYAGAPEGDDLAGLVSLVGQDRLHREIGRTEDWARTAETLVDLRERRVRGEA